MKKIIDGKRIIELRESRGWTQQDLAYHSGITGSVVSRLERNVQSDFKLSAIYAIANALDTTIDDLLQRESQIKVGDFIPQLNVALLSLSRQTPQTQRLFASMILSYIATLEEEKK